MQNNLDLLLACKLCHLYDAEIIRKHGRSTMRPDVMEAARTTLQFADQGQLYSPPEPLFELIKSEAAGIAHAQPYLLAQAQEGVSV